jgi:hypothetical protein
LLAQPFLTYRHEPEQPGIVKLVGMPVTEASCLLLAPTIRNVRPGV